MHTAHACLLKVAYKNVIPKASNSIRTMAFAVGAPTIWNILPSSVKSVENTATFRRHLKTYIYNLAYPSKLPGVSINLMTTGFVY